MKNQERFFNIMYELYTKAPMIAMSRYVNDYVNTGLMLQIDISNIIMSKDLRKYKDNIVILVRMYTPFSGTRISHNGFELVMPDKYEFFSASEIAEASFSNEKMPNALPVKLKILSTLRPNNYLTTLSIREIMALKSAGLIQWKSEMQRESVTTDGMVNGKLISHIKFDPSRSKEIAENIAEGTFYPSALRWHIIASDCKYQIDGEYLVLESGYFAEIDGQHRNKAIEYALSANPKAELEFPILISIGNVKTAQFIINQDEKRAPLSKERVTSYSNSFGRLVTDKIIALDELNQEANFISNPVEDIDVMKSELITAIDTYYHCDSSASNLVVTEIAKWITDFINWEYDFRYLYMRKESKNTDFTFSLATIRPFICISSFWEDDILQGNTDMKIIKHDCEVVFRAIYKTTREFDTFSNRKTTNYFIRCALKRVSEKEQ